jgi:mono/diheme cytochrome c family protein
MKIITAACGLLLAGSAWAEPFAGADPVQGQALHAKHCVACHSAQFGGPDGANAYLRADHKVKSASALAQRITVCTTMLKLELFPEDELNIAGYLNSRYYKFK